MEFPSNEATDKLANDGGHLNKHLTTIDISTAKAAIWRKSETLIVYIINSESRVAWLASNADLNTWIHHFISHSLSKRGSSLIPQPIFVFTT